jgi:hypothetical protein
MNRTFNGSRNMSIKHFVFEVNGEEVIKVSTGDAVGYIAASIPLEALEIWHRHFEIQLRRVGRLKFRVRMGKRRRLKHRRVTTRRVRLNKRYRGPVRHWSKPPQR